MAYRPINLSALQVGIESAGQQFGKDGKPLKSPKGATGIAQVMPSTGPEAAKLAGLPWDPKRFESDADYNMRLGDAYQGHLNKIFNGHQLAATAAYNAGPTRVLRLRQQYGDNWAKYLPDETKKYVKGILGVDVGARPGARQSFVDDIVSGLEGHGPYVVGQPGPNEANAEHGNFPLGVPGDPANAPEIRKGLDQYKSATSRYTDFLTNAIPQIHANSVALEQKTAAIASTKENLYNDFATREQALEQQIIPLQERRTKIVERLAELDAMSPLERRFKSAFNSEYDPRVLRGRLERTEMLLQAHQKTYDELNKIRSGVASLSVEADSADTDTLNAHARTIIADGQLLGQVAGAVHSNLDATLLPGQVGAEQIRLEQAAKLKMLGSLTVERVSQLAAQAEGSPDGTVTVDGVRLTAGELQGQAREAQSQDIRFRSLSAAYKAQDMQLHDEVESQFIDHMTPEQIAVAMQNKGQYNGQQLSMSKLVAAQGHVNAMRSQNVNDAVTSTAPGQAHALLADINQTWHDTSSRAKEMFGNIPGELNTELTRGSAGIRAWTEGLNAANARGVGQQYIASTSDQLIGLRANWDKALTTVANKWAGGKPELQAVAENYLRGNPLSGDAALKGLVMMARSGIPNGTRLTGPALQAFQVAQAAVKDWDSPAPQAGDNLQALLETNKTKKESDLLRIVQARVSSVYANGLTDSIMNSLPTLARQVKDPANPTRPHPFAAVNRDDFVAAVHHGDSEGYERAAQDMGITPQEAQALFNGGVENNPIWERVKKSKGLHDGDFPAMAQRLQSMQMVGTLQALSASHSAHPGFDPAKAFVSFINSEEAQGQIGKTVNGYGRSGFGAYMISSSAGGGFQDAFQSYAQSLSAAYTSLHATNLRQRINQQRSLAGDPWTRMNAVLAASDLSPQERQVLLQATKPLVNIVNSPEYQTMDVKDTTGLRFSQTQSNFDSIGDVIRNHRFEDKRIESIRRKAASTWEANDAIVQKITEGLAE